MSRVDDLAAERLRPQVRQITAAQRLTEDMRVLIGLIVTECLHHDQTGPGPRFFDPGAEKEWPGYTRGVPA